MSSILILSVQDASSKQWETSVAICQPWTKVDGWILPEVPPLITDILISLDDHFLYFSNWLRGDLVQYDISDPAHPRFVSRIWLGGVVRAGGSIKVTGSSYCFTLQSNLSRMIPSVLSQSVKSSMYSGAVAERHSNVQAYVQVSSK